MNQEALWQEINDLEDAMNDEESHYGKTPAWHTMKTEHSKLWKQATADGESVQTERRTVEIPYLAGVFYTTQYVELDWICPVCGGKRGDVYRTLSYDGSLRVNCDGWQNPCGHVDKYEDVLKEALKEAQAAFEAAPATPAQVDSFLFGKDVDVKRLQAHELHDASGAPVEDKDARIRQLEAIIANLQNSLLQEAHRAEKLEALLSEAAQVLAPFAESVAIDTDLMKAKDGAGLYIRNSDGDRFVPLETGDDELHVRQLRAIATTVDAIRKALNVE